MSTIATGRQSVLCAERTVTFDDFTTAVALPVIYLRPGTRVLRGYVDVTTAWNTGTTATMSVGDTEGTDDVDRYMAATDIKTAGIIPLVPVTDSVVATPEALTATVTLVGTAATAGTATIHIEFVEEDRTTELYPYRG